MIKLINTLMLIPIFAFSSLANAHEPGGVIDPKILEIDVNEKDNSARIRIPVGSKLGLGDLRVGYVDKECQRVIADSCIADGMFKPPVCQDMATDSCLVDLYPIEIR